MKDLLLLILKSDPLFMLYEHYNVVFTCTTRLEQVNGLLAQIEEEGTAQHRREKGGQEGKGKGEGEREGKTQ